MPHEELLLTLPTQFHVSYTKDTSASNTMQRNKATQTTPPHLGSRIPRRQPRNPYAALTRLTRTASAAIRTRHYAVVTTGITNTDSYNSCAGMQLALQACRLWYAQTNSSAGRLPSAKNVYNGRADYAHHNPPVQPNNSKSTVSTEKPRGQRPLESTRVSPRDYRSHVALTCSHVHYANACY